MSVGLALIVTGLVVALIGVGLALRPHFMGRPAIVGASDAAPIHDVSDAWQQASEAFRSVDRGVRTGVAVVVVGLLVAGVGAWLGSDARAMGADVGGTGSNDHARVGGTW